MSSRDQSDAVWIQSQRQTSEFGAKPRHHSIDFGSSLQSRFGFGRSMSVNSEGASTVDSSPPYSPIDMANSGSGYGKSSKALNIPPGGGAPGGGRFRTSSFSSGYGPSYGQDREEMERDPYLIHSPLSTSAPGMFRRSNSISVGALEYSHSKNSKNGNNNNGNQNLGPIDEIGKMYHFGDALKKSMGQLFNAPKMPPKGRGPGLGNGVSGGNGFGEPKDQKKKTQMTDRVVSLLCENAIR